MFREGKMWREYFCCTQKQQLRKKQLWTNDRNWDMSSLSKLCLHHLQMRRIDMWICAQVMIWRHMSF